MYASPDTAAPRPAQPFVRFPIVFTGNGAEYARIWTVNILLTILTCGLYYPWAMVGKFKYLYTHTSVAGQALDYHADPKPILWGNVFGSIVINGIFYGATKLGVYADAAHAGLQILMGLLLPLILQGFMQFQLTHTSWRGQRFGLTATVGDAFKAMGVPMLIYVASGAMAVYAVRLAQQGQTAHAAWLGAGGVLGLCICMPFMYYRYRRHQHRFAVYAGLANERPVEAGALPSICVRTTLMAAVALFCVALPVAWALANLLGFDFRPSQQGGPSTLTSALLVSPVFFFGTALLMALPYPYLGAHLQNSLWPNTAHGQVRFESQVPMAALLKLTSKNWLLILCTLGLYYPYAAMAEAHLRLGAMSVHLGSNLASNGGAAVASQTVASTAQPLETLKPNFSV